MPDLLRLARMTGDPGLEAKAEKVATASSGVVKRSPSGFTQFLSAFDFAEGTAYEVVIVGKPGAKDTQHMLQAFRSHFLPNKVVIFRPVGDGASEVTRLAGFTEHMSAEGGRATAYVCRNHQCQLPTTDVGQMLALLGVEGE